MRLDWIKCQGDVWCKLNSVNLDHVHFNGMEGVYIIWHAGTTPWTVYVGQGSIRERLAQHRLNQNIQKYSHSELYVTWAAVQQSSRDGVEAYLAEKLQPKEGERHPTTITVEVNLPW